MTTLLIPEFATCLPQPQQEDDDTSSVPPAIRLKSARANALASAWIVTQLS